MIQPRSDSLVGDIPRRAARRRGSDRAVAWRGGAMTYTELSDRVERMTSLFRAAGVEVGSRIAILAPNRPEHLEALFAAGQIGAVVVPLNLRLTADDVRYQIDDAGVTHGLVDPRWDNLASASGLHDRPTWTLGDALETALASAAPFSPPGPPRPPECSDLLQIYTSGTTGRPKGCVLSHRALLTTTGNVVERAGFNCADRYVCWAPLFHRGGLDLSVTLLAVGGTVILGTTPDPDEVWALAEEHSATSVGWMPGDLAVFDHPAARKLGPRMGPLVHGAAMDRPEMFDLIAEHWPNARYCGSYGLTEAGIAVTTTTAADEIAWPGTIGRASLHCDVAVLGSDGEPLPVGAIGELCVRGPSTMTGYWNRPADTAEALRGGWLHTGDLARMDDDGRLFFEGRAKDMVKSGGENVYCVEVEMVLASCPGVAEAVVFGVPDDRWGEAVKAVIVLEPDTTIGVEDLDDHCLGRLAPFKRPRWYEFRTADEVPRTTFRKVAKAELRLAHDPSRAIRLLKRS